MVRSRTRYRGPSRILVPTDVDRASTSRGPTLSLCPMTVHISLSLEVVALSLMRCIGVSYVSASTSKTIDYCVRLTLAFTVSANKSLRHLP
mgnify:CR=1 FL=1